MRRRISMLLAVALATVGFTVLDPTTPAKAWTLCGGTGTAEVGVTEGPPVAGTGILYPVGITTPFAIPKTPGSTAEVLIGEGNPLYFFSFSFTPLGTLTVTTPNCVHVVGTTPTTPVVTASGMVKGYCGLSSGTGTVTGGNLFAWIGVGGTLVLTGHLVGIVNAAPNPTIAGNSCTHGTSPGTGLGDGALTFIINGAVVALNCDSTLQTLVPGTEAIPPTTLIPVFTTQVLATGVHVLVNLGVHTFWNHQCVGSPVL